MVEGNIYLNNSYLCTMFVEQIQMKYDDNAGVKSLSESTNNLDLI